MKIQHPEGRVTPGSRWLIYRSSYSLCRNGIGIFAVYLSHRKSHPMSKMHRSSFFGKEAGMETRVALVGIIVEDMEAAERINALLHEYNQYVIGRMGLPYREKGISIISVVVNAEADIISSLAGKLGMIKGVNVKTVYSKK